MNDFPVIFVSHGAPDLPLTNHPAKQALQQLGGALSVPQSILIVSAHWTTAQLTIGEARNYSTMHDFYGFPQQLYRLIYPAQGNPELAQAIAERFRQNQIQVHLDADRGLDHGAWIPLMLMYPDADIPVVSISLPQRATAKELVQIGTILGAFRYNNLLICSGAVTHNLAELKAEGTPPASWAVEFNAWFCAQIASSNGGQALEHFKNVPHAQTAHPTDEHFLPILIALGAARSQVGKIIHESFSYGNISMTICAFGI